MGRLNDTSTLVNITSTFLQETIVVYLIKRNNSYIIMKLLFVCVGNTCRSQMAEALAKDMGFKVQSAGTHPGKNIAANAILVIEELGIEINNQYPKSIDHIHTESFDKIISMGCGVRCPNLVISEDWGLEDPIGKSLDFYRKTREKIQSLLQKLSQTQTDA
jgi:arsenate reductase (thioredoxin)